MRLNRLEISGFKSFPDRADLHFDRGVTAIVGPNGCGKSNVVDAITWVLGEQSARSLRGERMEDVIFNGSDARKPTAAAEVRLRLADVPTTATRAGGARRDAATGEEEEAASLPMPLATPEVRDVEIARRLYRSGESEYLIDGEVVRLRDVQDLLMDGGLGLRAYAVIEQGKIGQILTAKPTDRRVLIEEAAGVTKYKTRRRAAELKLEAARQNLARVEDVIHELERQRASLRRQAARARRYRRLREQLRHWEKVLYAQRYRRLRQVLDSARAQHAEAVDREAVARDGLRRAEEASLEARARLAAAEAEAAAARERAHATQLEAERRQQQLGFDRQQVADLAVTIEQLDLEIATLAARRDPVAVELEQRRQAAAAAEAARDRAADDLAAAQARLAEVQRRAQQAEVDLEDLRRQAFANSTTVTTLGHVIDRAREAAGRLAEEVARLDAEAASQQREHDRLASERTRLDDAWVTIQRELDRIRDAMVVGQERLAHARHERDDRRRDLQDRERETAVLEARLRSLEELEAARAGFGDAARAILSDPAIGLAHSGAVADFIEADPSIERAVEACHGELLQSVLVTSPEEARRGLELVRDRGLGRCGFLLTGAPAPSPLATPEVPPPGCRPLADGIRVNGPHAAAIVGSLGHAWLADSFEVALEASRRTATPVVTPAGDVFRSGRLVVGGDRAEARGLLATKRELKSLRVALEASRERVAAAGAALAAAEAAVVDAERLALDLAGALHEREKAAVGIEVQASRVAEDLERVARRLSLVATERQHAEQQRAEQLARIDEARGSVSRHAVLQEDLDARLAEVSGQAAGLREDVEAAATLVAEARAHHAVLTERAAALAHDVGRLEAAARELVERLDQRRGERERARHRSRELERAIALATDQIADDQRALEAARAGVEAADDRVGQCLAEVERAEAQARQARLLLDEARNVVAQIELARVSAESDLSHLASACQDSFQCSLEEVAAEVERQGVLEAEATADLDEDEAAEPVADLDATADGTSAAAAAGETPGPATSRSRLTPEEAIAELRARIDRLGPVNMMAIEQFDELEQRYGFLTSQRQDLVASIAQTGEAIRKIDRTTRERFSEAFTAISRYFEETFQTLFGGGRAGLVLIDESDPLESGIDIVAQPPGKRLQNVHLLSGGEKALTAMALMFAIFKYRPSPFCLLDEIDAPLDDANIGRFIEMLRGMQDRTQFVLVTHNRRTMEIADRLYGITMEEPGVSKLISIKLN